MTKPDTNKRSKSAGVAQKSESGNTDHLSIFRQEVLSAPFLRMCEKYVKSHNSKKNPYNMSIFRDQHKWTYRLAITFDFICVIMAVGLLGYLAFKIVM